VNRRCNVGLVVEAVGVRRGRCASRRTEGSRYKGPWIELPFLDNVVLEYQIGTQLAFCFCFLFLSVALHRTDVKAVVVVHSVCRCGRSRMMLCFSRP
jgi:hypothetical protein